VPVFAHSLGRSFLTGVFAYPPSEPTIGGAIAFQSRFLPEATTNLGSHLKDLPVGEVPGLPGWNWFNTPGHSPGNVSFYNQEQSVLSHPDLGLRAGDPLPHGGLLHQKGTGDLSVSVKPTAFLTGGPAWVTRA
jgi:glyoxylase-like metal-dependent hydrolase (beta-lactamase superfamily II)